MTLRFNPVGMVHVVTTDFNPLDMRTQTNEYKRYMRRACGYQLVCFAFHADGINSEPTALRQLKD